MPYRIYSKLQLANQTKRLRLKASDVTLQEYAITIRRKQRSDKIGQQRICNPISN